MVRFLHDLDIGLLLTINGHHTTFLDNVMWFASGELSWLPFYLFLIVLIVHQLKYEAIPLLLLIVALILLSDLLASGVIKPWVRRLRPSHEPGLEHLLHYINCYKGGKFGFMSSHASNVFALSYYLTFTVRRRISWLPLLLFPWAVLVAYSRVYLGVHYPSDVIVPIFSSMLIAFIISILYYKIACKYFTCANSPFIGQGM